MSQRSVIALLALLMATTVAAQNYTITDLGTLGGPFSEANGIGSLGRVVGIAETEDGNFHAFVYGARAINDLGIEGVTSVATSINGSSRIAGYYVANKAYHAFLWQDGKVTDLGNLGSNFAVAWALNSIGDVVGSSQTADHHEHAFLYSGGTMTDLGTLGGKSSTARSINSRRQITGYAYDATENFFAFLWENGTMKKLATLGGDWSKGHAINELGQIAGQAYLTGNAQAHAVLYSGGGIKDLGTLGGQYSDALAINSSGTEIVGSAMTPSIEHAFIYRNGRMQDLNQLVTNRGGWVLTTATAVDDTGEIAGYGLINGEQHAFLLTPEGMRTPTVRRRSTR